MAALAVEGITLQPSPSVRAIASQEDGYVPAREHDTVPPSEVDLPVGNNDRVEELQVQDAQMTSSQRIKVLREVSCYLSLYISGYK